MNPQDFSHPDDYAKAFTVANPGYFPTYFSSLQCSWTVVRETEKAVMIEDSDFKGAWFPKSQVLVEAGRITGVKKGWYRKISMTATRQRGF